MFCGIDEYENEIFELLEPILCNNMFYYNCGSKFETEIFYKYFNNYNGIIIFSSGEHTIFYKYDSNYGKFQTICTLTPMIPNKHNKGGSSSGRFGRISDNVRHKYILVIIEKINLYCDNKNNWIFGSNDILDDVFTEKSQIKKQINRGHYIEFDKNTISNTLKWLYYLEQNNNNDNIYKSVIDCLNKDNMICFDLQLYEQFEYIIINPELINLDNINDPDKKIHILNKNSIYYAKLKDYPIIGKLYYNQYNNELNN